MTAHQVGVMLLGLAAIIVLARLLGAAAKRVGQPPVVGEILAGILVGPTLFGSAVSDHLFPTDVRAALAGLANVGLVLFMFIVGYELDHTLVRGKERVAVSVSIGSIVLPFALGAGLAVWLAANHGIHAVLPFALFLGAAMSVTAFPVLARILTDRGMHRITVGGLALASAAVDDVIAWTLLAVVVTVGGGGADQWHVLFAIPYVLVMFLGVRPLLRRLAAAYDKAGRLTPNILAAILVGLLLSCYATEWLGVHFIFGAFIFGAIMPRTGAEALRHEILERLEQVSVLLLLPVFFVSSGMKVDLSTVDLRGLVELSLILAVAIGGKFIGAYAGARLQGVRSRQAGALAALMNTRGLTEIVILTVGLQLGILDGRLFSLMVVMALATTVMAGPLLALIYPKRRVERDIAETEKAALGVSDAYRVLVVVDTPGTDDGAVEIGADLVGTRRPGEVVLSHLVPYQTPGRLEVGSGLSGELLEMTTVMGQLDALAGPVRERGVGVPVLARLSADPARELPAQVVATEPDVVVIGAAHPAYDGLRRTARARLVIRTGPLPASWDALRVRLDGGPHADAALQVAAQLAAARGAALVVEATGRIARRINAVVAELNRNGLTVDLAPATPAPGTATPTTGPATAIATAGSASGTGMGEPSLGARPATPASPAGQTTLIVAPEGGRIDGAHLLIHADPDADPTEWIPLLPRAPIRAPISAGVPRFTPI
jgi:Kef-type K+ transport system membrane component KefB